jgi:hypothetical protein
MLMKMNKIFIFRIIKIQFRKIITQKIKVTKLLPAKVSQILLKNQKKFFQTKILS